MTKDDLIDEIISKHNDLCDLLTDMKLNPLADFEDFKIDNYLESEEDLDYDDESENEGNKELEY